MDTILVVLIVLSAAAFIGRRIFVSVRSARRAKEGCSDCGCGADSSAEADWSKS
jgi:hypothetical protein